MYSPTYKRYVTALLLIIYIFNQADRAIFSFLMEPIKLELALSDSDLGFLAGPAMVLFYATLGIPIARMADRGNRVNIICIAISLWSAVVTATSAVGTFVQLALARVGVGVGEAGFSAIAQSLLADFHPPAERPRALSTFMLALPLGGVVSGMMGGWLNQAFGWRSAFLAAGIPGIVLALLLRATVREPSRHSAQQDPQPEALRLSSLEVLATVWRRPAIRHLALGSGLGNIVVASLLSWLPTFFVRSHGVGSGEMGTWLAVIGGVGGSAGTWLGGYLTSRASAKDDFVKVRIVAAAMALMVPVVAAALWCPSKTVAFLLLIPGEALLFFFFGPVFALVQTLCAPGIRATVASIFILIQVLSGGVIGVQLLGVLSDALVPLAGDDALALRVALSVILMLALGAAAHFLVAARRIRHDTATTMAQMRPA